MTVTKQDASQSTWKVVAIAAYLAKVVMNALANTLPLFGRDTGDISASYPSLFTPAPYTFAVWGVIYLALAGFCIYQALPRASAQLAGVRPLFVLSCVLNIGWLVSWHALLIPLSEIVMIALLLTLIALYRRADAWRGSASASGRWLVHLPLSLYLGWIAVATVANTAITLLDLGFDGGSAAMALTALVIVAAAGLGVLGDARRRDGGYALVIAWGLAGVAAARSSEGGMGTLVVLAVVCVVLLVLAGVWAVVSRPGDHATAASH